MVLMENCHLIEEVLRMEEMIPRGVIQCPCCSKGKILAYEGVAGKSSIQCSKCHVFLLVDYDKMTAKQTLRKKEVYKMVVNK